MSDDFTVSIADADQYRIAFAGILLSRGAGASGYADGEYLKIVRVKESFTVVEGTDGTIARSKTNSRLVTITIRLLQTNAQSNGLLSALLSADEGNPNGAGIGTFVVADLNGTTFFKCLKSWLQKWPDQSFDRTAKEREWMFQGAQSQIVVGGN
jgi:hypothetical protein